MSLAKVFSRTIRGLETIQVSIEVHLSNGLPKLNIVGLAEMAVREAKERVRSALINGHFEFPAKRITVSLSPCDLPKDGGHFDLPIAIGILAASHQLPINDLVNYEFLGELALSGELCAINHTLSFAKGAMDLGRTLILPECNAKEAGQLKDLILLPARHLNDVIAHIKRVEYLSPYQFCHHGKTAVSYRDLKEVRGQLIAKQALEIAAAGKHNLLMIGSPGVGKTMLASCFPGILPALTENQNLETALIYSYSKQPYEWNRIPFREPHHTASYAALVGGGNPPKAGEISLAHHGVLFLDELTQFKQSVLDALREPLESKQISIARVDHRYIFPANFQLIAAMNPCPCGQLGDPNRVCYCHEWQIKKFQQKISGPILERIDIKLFLTSDFRYDQRDDHLTEDSATVLERVLAARDRQYQRWQQVNALVQDSLFYQSAYIPHSLVETINQVIDKYHLSPRAILKILRVARTIADLEDSPLLLKTHLMMALQFTILGASEFI